MKIVTMMKIVKKKIMLSLFKYCLLRNLKILTKFTNYKGKLNKNIKSR